MKNVSAAKFLKKEYEELDFIGVWGGSFGTPEKRSRILVYGEPKNGKTDFCVQLANYLGIFGKVLYISKEEGERKSLQACWKRNEVRDNVILGIDYCYRDIVKMMKKKLVAVIIDSVDYFKMTEEEVKELFSKQKKTMLIFVTWGEGKRFKTAVGEKLEFMVDVVVRVSGFVGYVRSRYGGGEDFVVWEEGARRNHYRLNRG